MFGFHFKISTEFIITGVKRSLDTLQLKYRISKTLQEDKIVHKSDALVKRVVEK